jgi:hypothetical protein
VITRINFVATLPSLVTNLVIANVFFKNSHLPTLVTCLGSYGKKFVETDDEDDDIIDICDGDECIDMGDEQDI